MLVGDVQPQAAIELSKRRSADGDEGRSRRDAGAADRQDRTDAARGSSRLRADDASRSRVPFRRSARDESYAVDIANTIFGGYFVSRWVDNLRERNGYTYSPHSQLVHLAHANYLEVSADVGTDVTAASLVETSYELGRMCATEVTPEELESAKRYRTGIQALRIQSQAGLASTLASLVTYGFGVDYLRTYPQRITELTASDIRVASSAYLAPTGLITVMVGDASRVAARCRHSVRSAYRTRAPKLAPMRHWR